MYLFLGFQIWFLPIAMFSTYFPFSRFKENEFELGSCAIQSSPLLAGKVSMISSIILSSLFLETSKRIVLFSIFSSEKLNCSSINAVTLSLAICNSFSFSQSLRFFRPFSVFLFNLSLGCTGTCFTKTTSSLVTLANLSLGCTGTSFAKATSSSSLLFSILIFFF